MLQILEILETFADAASIQAVATDYMRLDCITSIFTGFLGRSQPLPFWKAFLPVFNNVFSRHGATLMSRENDRFLKQVAFHLLRLGVFRNESIRKRAVIGIQILIRVSSFVHFISCCFSASDIIICDPCAIVTLVRSILDNASSIAFESMCDQFVARHKTFHWPCEYR